MGHFEIIPFENAAALARSAAERLLQFLSGRQKRASLCLSGGRITVSFFHELVKQCQSNQPGRDELIDTTDFFWADERCVASSDPESNFGIAHQQLFNPLKIATARIHRIHGETDPVLAAKRAEAELCRLAPLNSGGIPVIDLLLLGLGEDGHVASLFPNQVVEVQWANAIYHPVIGPKPPPRRITLSYPAILAAKEVWVLVSGKGKENALHRSLAGDSAIPLGRVLGERLSTLILSDLRME